MNQILQDMLRWLIGFGVVSLGFVVLVHLAVASLKRRDNRPVQPLDGSAGGGKESSAATFDEGQGQANT